MNEHGDEIIPPMFKDAFSFSENLAVAKKSGKWGYISKDGNWAIKVQFNQAWSMKSGLACGRINDDWLLFNSKGETIFRFTRKKGSASDYFISLNGNLPLVQLPEGSGIMNAEGKWIVPPIYRGRIYLSDGGWGLQDENLKFHIFDRTGVEILADFGIGYLFDYSDDIAVIKILNSDRNTVYVNKNGNIIKDDAKSIYPFKNGVLPVYDQEGNIGLMDTEGNWIAKYNDFGFLYQLEDGCAAYVKDRKVGYINEKGAIITPPLYDSQPFAFENKHAIVKSNAVTGIIDSAGNLVAEMSNAQKKVISPEIYAVEETIGKWSFYAFTDNRKLFQKDIKNCYPMEDGLILFSREVE